MERWYTLHTQPNAEYQVAATLTARGIHTYLPQLELPKKYRRRGRTTRPFFPCYLFMQADLTVTGLSAVRWTPGLRRLVTFDEQPVPLDDAVIELIRRKLGEIKARGGPAVYPFKPGETVRITDGPFADMLAVFDGPTTAGQRVQVLLNILGHASRVQLEADQLTKAPAQATAPAPKRPRRTRGRGRRIQAD